MLIDMKYLLRHRSVAEALLHTPQQMGIAREQHLTLAKGGGGEVLAGEGRISCFRTLLRILRRFQLVDTVVRQRGEHIRYETRVWQRTFAVIPTIFDSYLLALSFLYRPQQGGQVPGGETSPQAGAVTSCDVVSAQILKMRRCKSSRK